MTAVSRTTGLPISDLEHIQQSIGDILTTPLGSRVMRREYGSLLPDLIDAPANNATTVKLYAAIASALLRWEPRVRLSRVQLQVSADGAQVLTLEGTRVGTDEPANLRVPISLGATA